MNFGFIIDNRKCIGCHACTVACKSEHDVPVGVNRTWVKYIEKGTFPHTRRLFSVMRCNHCADAPCVDICPTSALFTRSDGIVDFDNRRCIGCKACMQACPYDALYIDPETHTAAKCNYCAHRVDIGLEPACVIVCPEHAIISGDMDDPDSEISRLLAGEQVTARKVEKGTQPKLVYIDGDEASLNPTRTERVDSYMWSSQSAGVGHFARFAEQRLGGAELDVMQHRFAGEFPGAAEQDEAGTGGDNNLKVTSSMFGDTLKRVYDAPAQGPLWGWEVAAYIWTKAVASGAFLLIFLAGAFKLAAIPPGVEVFGLSMSLLFLILTTVLLVKDLDQPRRFLYVLLRPQWSSWLVRGGYALALYGAAVSLWGISRLLNGSVLETSLAWAGAALAVITATYTAFLFAQARGRDFWQSPTLSLHMLTHAVLAGAALFATAMLFSSDMSWGAFVTTALQIGLAFNLFIIAIELLTAHATDDARATVNMITRGHFRSAFWGAAILLGNVVPLILLTAFPGSFVAIAGPLVLFGIYITEHIWVHAPQRIPLS